MEANWISVKTCLKLKYPSPGSSEREAPAACTTADPDITSPWDCSSCGGGEAEACQALPAPTQGAGTHSCGAAGTAWEAQQHPCPGSDPGVTFQRQSNNCWEQVKLLPKPREVSSTEHSWVSHEEYFTVTHTRYMTWAPSKAQHDLQLTSAGFSLICKSSRHFTRMLLNSHCLQPHKR